MILVFDLDDTLYDEMQFVKCGFYAVSDFLSKKFGLNNEITFKRMIEILESEGRGKVFNTILEEHNIFTKKNVKDSLSAYRNNKPKLSLFDDAKCFIDKYSSYTKYVVTDGNKLVQKNKIISLGLDKVMKKAIPTHQYGTIRSKPSPYVFFKILEFEKAQSKEVIYFGDNPYKDFVGIKPFGFNTIRLNRGQYKNLSFDKKHDADIIVPNFDAVTFSMLTQLTKS